MSVTERTKATHSETVFVCKKEAIFIYLFIYRLLLSDIRVTSTDVNNLILKAQFYSLCTGSTITAH